MAKLTCPRSTSRGFNTRWELNSGRGIRIPSRVPLNQEFDALFYTENKVSYKKKLSNRSSWLREYLYFNYSTK